MEDWQNYSFLLGVVLLIFTIVRIGRRRARKRALERRAPGWDTASVDRAAKSESARATDKSQLKGLDDTLNALLVQLSEVGREIEARLDTKVRYASRLIEEADETLRRLGEATARAERSLLSKSDTATSARSSVQTTRSTDGGAPASSDSEATIRELSGRGLTAAEIARKIKQPIGEVKLILGLAESSEPRS